MGLCDFLSNKKIIIWGYGREGKSTEQFIRSFCTPASLDIFEGKPEELDDSDADLVIKSPGIAYFEDNAKVTSQTELFLAFYGAQTVGITGTKGKSTTSSMLAHVLAETTNRPVLLVGNIGLPCLDYASEITPETIIVYELSCHQLSRAKDAPHIGVFLNLYEEHLDYYKTLDRYFAAKSHIVSCQKEGDIAYLGMNVPEIESAGTQVRVDFDPGERMELAVFGDHNQLNAQFVMRIATENFGVSREAVREAVKSFHGLAHRLAYVGEFAGKKWYDDSISTIPAASIQAAESIPEVVTVLVGGMDRGIDYALLKEYIPSHPEYAFVLMYETGERIAHEMKEAGPLPGNIYITSDLAEAVETANRITPSGKGCVMSPAAASYKYFKNFEERGDVFAELVSKLR